ncbi:hypothetical protein AALA69_08255 [Eggerthellaceae bacterium 24-137]
MELQWPLIIFTLFMCLGAGILFAAGLAAVRGEDDAVKLPSIVATTACMVLGGFASALHLHHWERIFNGFGHLTSGITHELIGIVVVMAAVILYFALFRGKKTAKWMGVVAMAASVLLIVLMTHSYAMPARPVWNVPFMYLVYLGNMGLFGFLSLGIMGAATKSDTSFAMKAALVSGVVQLIGCLGFATLVTGLADSFSSLGYYFMSTDPSAPLKDPGVALLGLTSFDLGLIYWGVTVLIGCVVPLAAAVVLGLRKGEGDRACGVMVAALACALVGGVAFRMVFFLLGYSQYVFY